MGETAIPRRAEAASGFCGGCQRPILWMRTATGAAIPVDPDPEQRLIITTEEGELVAKRAEVMERIRDHRSVYARSVATYMPHHATCPKADQYRGPRRQKGHRGRSGKPGSGV